MKRYFSYISILALLLNPLMASAMSYRVQPGDTMWQLSRQWGTTVKALAEANGILNPDVILAGELLLAPDVTDEYTLGGSGGAYTPVSGYQSRTTQYLTSSGATINVASTKDQAGNEIALSNVSGSSTVRIYLTLEPGSTREEIVQCIGKSVGIWSSCTRGLSFQGGDQTASTTLQMAHNAGSIVIISNVGQFFNQYISVSGNQLVDDLKTFNQFPRVTSTVGIPTNAAELASKYYVDTIGAGGFTAANVSSTGGLTAITSGVPNCSSAAACAALNVSSTGGVMLNPTTGAVALSGIVNTSTIYNGQTTFNNTSTFAAEAVTSFAPISSLDITSWKFQQGNSATGTAGTSTVPGQALYISSTGTLFLTSAANSSTVYEFVGIAQSTTAIGGVVTYARPGGVVGGLSGLTSNRLVYLGDASGTVSNSLGTIPASIGRSLSATSILLQTPNFQAATSGSFAVDVNGAVTTNLNTIWQPTKVNLICGAASASIGKTFGSGSWMRNNDGSSQQASVYSSSTSAFSTTSACGWTGVNAGLTSNLFTVATTTNGFSITNTGNSAGGGQNVTVQYFAEYNGIYPTH